MLNAWWKYAPLYENPWKKSKNALVETTKKEKKEEYNQILKNNLTFSLKFDLMNAQEELMVPGAVGGNHWCNYNNS